MLMVYSSERDSTNFAVSDQPLAVNSCGLNSTLGSGRRLSDAVYVRRPAGRKDFQLLYVCFGRAEHYLDGAWRTVRAGQAVLYWPDTPQFYLYRAQTPVQCKWVHFSGGMARPLLEKCGLRPEEVLLEIGQDREISQLFDRLIQESQLRPPCHEAVAPALLYQLIGLMGRRRAILQDEGGYQARQRLMRVVEHMHYHYDEPQSIDQYAAQCGMSRFHFAHAFKACIGQAPYAYLTRLRMEHAREMLIGSEMRVADIARNCGYESPLYFSRAFSRRFGLPPTVYKKRYGHQAPPGKEGDEDSL